MNKLRGLLRRPAPADEIDVPPVSPSLDDAVRHLAADVARLREAQRSLDQHYASISARLDGSADTLPSVDFGKLESSLSALQDRVAELSANREAASLRVEQAERTTRDVAEQTSARLERVSDDIRRSDRARADLETALRDVQDALALSSHQAARSRDEVEDRDALRDAGLMTRIRISLLLNLIALAVAAGAMAMIYFRVER